MNSRSLAERIRQRTTARTGEVISYDDAGFIVYWDDWPPPGSDDPLTDEHFAEASLAYDDAEVLTRRCERPTGSLPRRSRR